MFKRLQIARRKARALVDGGLIVAGSRGLTPWIRPQPLPVVEYPKVFIVGCPRSGTTWVAEMFGRHPNVVGGRESHLYSSIHRSVGERGRFSVLAWARLFYGIARGAAMDNAAGLHHYVDGPTLARISRSVMARSDSDDDVTNALVRAILDDYFLRSGGGPGDVLVEKTPLHIYYMRSILSTFPESHIIEVVRDGRDVCVSMQMRATRDVGWPTAREAQIKMWMQCVNEGLALQRDPSLRDRVTVVRYEGLKANAGAEMQRLLTNTGLASPPDLIADIVASTDISKYKTMAGEFRYRGEVGSWVDNFTAEDSVLFKSMVGGLFERIGYAY